ncbi:WW domain-containing oxidoreductase [Trichinella spiralis]|uniref:WW domain-containing oxidoreductase n=1 Tax=Trichinella spiralis TaxID=6334 RepID=UPI0001EFCAD9|nr:WW domain-containing oxidoreductase [Trichinella spiralis]
MLGFAESDSEDELPSGWEERTTLDNRVYYVKYSEEDEMCSIHFEKSVQWNHPRTDRRKTVPAELPKNWKRVVDEENKILYENQVTGFKTYADPRLAAAFEETGEEEEEQLPRQRFDARTKALQVLHGIDLSNKTVMITGGTSGIGLEVVKAMLFHGANVIIACRNISRARDTVAKLHTDRRCVKVEFIHCDLASMSSVRRCAETFLASNWKLNVLILNAATLEYSYSVTEDGLERTFSKLQNSTPARIVITTGESHRLYALFSANYHNLDEDELISRITLTPENKDSYSGIIAYSISKLCLTMFAFYLNEKFSKQHIFCNAVHPGNLVPTKLYRRYCCISALVWLLKPFTKSADQAASTIVFAAFSPDLNNIGGVYLNSCWFCSPSATSTNRTLQRRLWNLRIIHDIIQPIRLNS